VGQSKSRAENFVQPIGALGRAGGCRGGEGAEKRETWLAGRVVTGVIRPSSERARPPRALLRRQSLGTNDRRGLQSWQAYWPHADQSEPAVLRVLHTTSNRNRVERAGSILASSLAALLPPQRPRPSSSFGTLTPADKCRGCQFAGDVRYRFWLD
jgi:hypothetical protein